MKLGVVMDDILELIKERKSLRVPFDPDRQVTKEGLMRILDAGRWAPTPHNMQNFEIVVVDDRRVLGKIGNVRSSVSEVFLRETYKLFSFSKEEFLRKRVGVLSATFPEAWRDPAKMKEAARESESSPLSRMIGGSPMLLVVIYDPRKRAPASEGDVLGFMGLGCVMENMWIMSESLGIGFQILSTISNAPVEKEVKSILNIPENMEIAFTARLGYPLKEPTGYLRVRRDLETFVHYNKFGNRSVK